MVHDAPLYELTEDALEVTSALALRRQQLPQHGTTTVVLGIAQQLHQTFSHFQALQGLQVGSLDSLDASELPEGVQEVGREDQQGLGALQRQGVHLDVGLDGLQDAQPPLDEVVLDVVLVFG